MSDWKEYTGSDEQIAEILQSDLFMVDSTTSCFQEPSTLCLPVTETCRDWLREIFERGDVGKYLICTPHPKADMICQQARTGQSVWVRYEKYNDKNRRGYLPILQNDDTRLEYTKC